ncbi:helix-turn-helix domain-containing protein [Streptomyces sp. NPDC049577]|uniref:TetR/AcrR family transcriptional regulator n=1 Tax=Streptomyces sp. NPDC049577 TaxID=3155153 RepID=UPI00341AB4DD
MTSADTAPLAAPAGIRGRKRERTRRAISDAAFRLFAERGFDAVTLNRIAAEADVAPATVFTHFASKEDIFFSRREEFRAGLPAAVTGARTGAEVIEGVRRFFADACELVLGAEAVDNGRIFARVLLESPALARSYLPLARQRQTLLAELLAERAGAPAEGPDRAELDLFAALAVAAGETAFDALHRALAAGEPVERVRRTVTEALDRAFARLARAYEDSPVLDVSG